MRFGPLFDRTRLDPIRALADPMCTYCAVERLPQRLLCRGFSKKERRAKGMHSLEGSREAEGARHKTVMDGRSSYYTPNQIIGQDIHPQFFPHHGRRFPPDDIHPERRLEGSQIKFRIPSFSSMLLFTNSCIVSGPTL